MSVLRHDESMGEADRGDLRPFAAEDSALSERQLRKRTKLLRGVYADPGMQPTARMMARAAWIYGRGDAVLGGRSAAAALGVKYLDSRREKQDPQAEAEAHGERGPYRYAEHEWSRFDYYDPEPPVLIRPRSGGHRPCPGLTVRRIDLPPSEVVTVRGMRVTSPARTGFDLARWPASAGRGWDAESAADFERRLVMLDALCNATKVTPGQIEAVVAAHRGSAGRRRARRLLALVDGGADSPPETRLRLFLIRRGFPAPVTQHPVFNEYGVLHGHLDLAWPKWRVGIEYDGEWHRKKRLQRSNDIVRYEGYDECGWDVLQVDKYLMQQQAVLVEKLEKRFLRAEAPW